MTSKPTGFDIGRRLGSARAQRGMSQGTLSRLSGLAPSYVSRIENGHVQPTLATVLKILHALRMGLDELIAPEPAARALQPCPVSPRGSCLLELIRSEAEVARDARHLFFSPREVAVLRALAGWMKEAPGERVRAVTTVIEMVTGSAGRAVSPEPRPRVRPGPSAVPEAHAAP